MSGPLVADSGSNLRWLSTKWPLGSPAVPGDLSDGVAAHVEPWPGAGAGAGVRRAGGGGIDRWGLHLNQFRTGLIPRGGASTVSGLLELRSVSIRRRWWAGPDRRALTGSGRAGLGGRRSTTSHSTIWLARGWTERARCHGGIRQQQPPCGPAGQWTLDRPEHQDLHLMHRSRRMGIPSSGAWCGGWNVGPRRGAELCRG